MKFCSMQKSPLWKANSSWTSHKVSNFMCSEVLLSCSQEPPPGPCRGTGRGYHCKCKRQKKGIKGGADNSNNSYPQHWMEMNFSFTPRPLYPQVKSTLHPLNRKLGGLQSRPAGDRTHDSSAVQPTAVTTPTALFRFCSHHKPPESCPQPFVLYL